MKYTNQGFTIHVPLNDTYTIRATILRVSDTEDTHDFTLELGREDTGIWQVLSDDCVYRIQAQKANSETADYILALYRDGQLTPAIDNYEYWLKCVTYGNRIFEEAAAEIQKKQEA